MTASELLASLRARGVRVWADGQTVRLDADRGVLTDADREAVKAIKPQMLALLTRPALGTIRRPLTARGFRLPACPWDACAGELSRHDNANLYLCKKCGWYFELLPPLTGETQ